MTSPEGEAFVEGVVNAPVGFGDQARQKGPVFFEHFKGAVRRTAIDDDIFESGPILRNDASKGRFDRSDGVEANGDDRYGNGLPFHT